MRTVDVASGTAASSSSVFALVDFPRFRLLVALAFVAVLVTGFFAFPSTEALVALLADFSGADFPLIELLVERGAAAEASEVLLGLDDDAVGSTAFFSLFVVAVPVASAAVVALRLAGAMISI